MAKSLLIPPLLLLLAAAPPALGATLPDGCTTPANTKAEGFATWQSPEPVCVRARCLAEADGAVPKPPSAQLPSDGGKLMEDMLRGDPVSDSQVSDYITAVVTLVVPGVLFFLVNVCCGSCLCCGRVCKCPCCRCAPQTKTPYTPSQIRAPAALWALFALLSLVFAVVGITAGTATFASSFIRGGCMLDTTTTRISGFIASVLEPLDDLNDDFGRAAHEVGQTLGDTSNINDAIADLERRFEDLEEEAGKHVCSQRVEGAAGVAKTQTADQARALERDLDQVQQDVQTNLLDAEDTIAEATADAKVSAEDMEESIDTSMASASETALNTANFVSDHYQ